MVLWSWQMPFEIWLFNEVFGRNFDYFQKIEHISRVIYSSNLFTKDELDHDTEVMCCDVFIEDETSNEFSIVSGTKDGKPNSNFKSQNSSCIVCEILRNLIEYEVILQSEITIAFLN